MKNAQFKLPVLAIVKKGNQVLLIQRHNPENPYSHAKWAFPGGGIEFGEHPVDTVIRETLEETGRTINPLSDNMFIENHVFEDVKVHVVAICYPAKYISGEINFSNEPGIMSAKWFNIKDIDYTKCLPKTKEILKRALKNF